MPASVAAASRSARKPKGEGHARRAEILEAAERLFVEHGYEGATIRKIADEVGLSSTALYMHFADKGEMLSEICRGAFQALVEGSRETIARLDAPDARLRALMADYARFGLEHSNAYRLIYMTRPSEAKEGAEGVAQASGAELYRLFLEQFEALDAAGRLIEPVPVAAQLTWAGVHGVVSLRITKGYLAWEDTDRLCAVMLDALFARLVR